MNRFEVKKVRGREVLDCRGTPTVEVDIMTEGGALGRASVPCGLSKGRYEAAEVRDGGRRYYGKGVLNAVRNVNEVIAPKLLGVDVRDQRIIDDLLIELDGTEDKSKLGSNAILGVSLASAKAAAQALTIPLYRYLGGSNARVLPIPMLNILGGGKLAGIDLEIQECIIMPTGAKSFVEGMEISTEVYFELGTVVAREYGKTALNVGDDGSYTPNIKDVHVAFDLILEAVEALGYRDKISLAMDSAASHFYDTGKQKYSLGGKLLSAGEMIDLYMQLISKYHIISIEDPLNEDDFEGFAELTKKSKIQIVGDDFFATNSDRLKKGIEVGAANAVLLKVNQIGTLSEAMDVARLAFRNSYGVVVSERSGETEDPFIADLSVALNCGQIKSGAPCRSEHTAKYNELLRIEEELGSSAKYAGDEFKIG